MSELNRKSVRDVTSARRSRPTAPVEAIRDCITPILTSTLIARSVCHDRRAELALEIIERQMQRLSHLLTEEYGLDLQPRLD